MLQRLQASFNKQAHLSATQPKVLQNPYTLVEGYVSLFAYRLLCRHAVQPIQATIYPLKVFCLPLLSSSSPPGAAEITEYQAAKLVCYQEYHKWREARLQSLVTWFAAQYPGKLDAELLGKVCQPQT